MIHFDLAVKELRIAELEKMMLAENFWSNQANSQKVISETNALKEIVNGLNEIEESFKSSIDTVEFLEEEFDEEFFDLLEEDVKNLEKTLDDFELKVLLSGEFDRNNCVLEIHPGAGGTESQDWASMLYRMYQRYAEKKGYKIELIDYQDGEEAGLKSVTILIKGVNAFGYLKSEKGVHRLVRISPFDSSGRRHTSFASVDVIPEINNDVSIEIKDEEIKIDTYRSSGAGGQSVNTTDSAVRITHIPTGTVVTCQNERSQIKNREKAMELLKMKLHQLEIQKKEQEMAALRGEQLDIGWGSQIRSYVFHPYSMVKDHRTNAETGNSNAVLDGDIGIFIDAYLRKEIS